MAAFSSGTPYTTASPTIAPDYGKVTITIRDGMTGTTATTIQITDTSDDWAYFTDTIVVTPAPVEPLRTARAFRLAQIRLWTYEANQKLFRNLQEPYSPEDPVRKYGLSKERLRIPVRKRFKKRVCGDSNRYRVMVP